jgi:tRNA (guanine-N7-)-methyltransferase
LYGETSSPHAPTLTLPLRGREGDTAVPVTNTHAANDAYQRTALEIGFGAGEHLAAQARHHPETLYLGSEPYINGVAKLLAVIEREKLTNIRIDTRDVRELISELPGAALNEIFILFPDPWPKARHHKRRLINAQTLAMLARVHRPGGRLLIATDHLDYTDWICEYLLASDVYHWQKTRDPHQPPPDWTETKYQRKTSAEGRRPRFFECERRRV